MYCTILYICGIIINKQIKMENLTQTAKIGAAGSFINQMMGNNSSLPVVGKGATQLHHTDRTAFEVVEVSEDGKTAKLEYLNAACDCTKEGGQGHQNWLLAPTGRFVTVTWRNGAWRKVGCEIVFTEAFQKQCSDAGINYIGMYLRKNNPELANMIYGGRPMPQNVVEGYTKEKKCYEKVNILFGEKEYYYDWEF